ncbi:hypothetical protein RHECNPAF_280064 [Rhizobium etli CNPAF512]|nr:hypothetical protein RHECNPAF_280064 [Rhizobium etli CNPAF512]
MRATHITHIRDAGFKTFHRGNARIRQPIWQPYQSPEPGFSEKYFSNLPVWPSISLASGSGSFLTVIFGQMLAYSVLIFSHLSRPGSVSGLIASAGHSGSQTPQSMHSSGWMTRKFSPS